MDDNWRTVIGYICIALVSISWFLGGAWIMSPTEFTINLNTDNNTLEVMESIEESIDKIPICEKLDNFTFACPEGYSKIKLSEDQIGQIIDWAEWKPYNINVGEGEQ